MKDFGLGYEATLGLNMKDIGLDMNDFGPEDHTCSVPRGLGQRQNLVAFFESRFRLFRGGRIARKSGNLPTWRRMGLSNYSR